MDCGNITEYTGLKPYEQTDPNEIVKACNGSLKWMIENLTPELNAAMPDICAAAQAGGLVNFKGVCGEAGTPTSGFQKGWTVFKDSSFFYCLRDTDSCPPSVDWEKVGNNGGVIGDGLNRIKLVANELWLYSKYGEPTQRAFVINKHDNDDGITLKIVDNNDNIIGTVLKFDHGSKRWNTGVMPTTNWNSASLYSGYTGSILYRKLSNGIVEVVIKVYNANGGSSYGESHIATLPTGFRPSTKMGIPTVHSRQGYCSAGRLETNGQLYLREVGKYYAYANLMYFPE